MNNDVAPKSFLHYALGSGLGHLTRQFAIARSLQKQTAGKFKSTIVVNSEFAPVVTQAIAHRGSNQIQFETLPSTCSPTEAENLLARLIGVKQCACLIVDVFPRGLGGELSNCFANHPDLPKALVARNLPPAYLQQFQVESFVQKNYHRIFRIEPEAPFANLPQTQLTFPVVFQSADANANPNPAQSDQRRILIVGSGTPAECQALRKLTAELKSIAHSDNHGDPSRLYEFHFHGPTLPQSNDLFHWPLVSQLAGYDLVVGNAGYNLFWETQLAQVPAVLFAQPRKYDDQSIRSKLNWPMPAIEIFDRIRSKLSAASQSTGPTLVRNSIDDLTTSILSLLKSFD